uniref:Peptidase S1 domain-containing protein n=1 Tax=Caenorhabditis tropicalis TaxID=1561998 RepID=A0A1I7TTT1_9PELO
MIVEFEKELEVDVACLIKKDGVKTGDLVDISMMKPNGTLDKLTVNVSSIEEWMLHMRDLKPVDYLEGAPLHQKVDNKWTMIGFYHNDDVTQRDEVDVQRMSRYQETICEWAGICETPIPIESKKTKKPEKEEQEEEEAKNGEKVSGYTLILLFVSLYL